MERSDGAEGSGIDRSSSDNEERRLHYLGPPGTYSHQVALALASRLSSGKRGLNPVLQPCPTITSTYEEASERSRRKEQVSWALLPFENNSNGPVVDSYDILYEIGLPSTEVIVIVEEFYLPVSHSLMCTESVYEQLCKGVQGGGVDLTRLDVVSSHTQALGQCSQFLSTSLKEGVELIATSSTGEAARQLVVAQGEGTTVSNRLEACIASNICAESDVYKLRVLESDIQNSSKNVTRFLLLEFGSELANRMPYRGNSSGHMRMMLKITTHAASKSLTDLTKFVNKPIEENVRCLIRSIERRAVKDDVDDGDDALNAESGQGHWPFVYLVEIEARGEALADQSRPSKKAKKNGKSREAEVDDEEEDGIDEITPTQKALASIIALMQTIATEEDCPIVHCLGIWSVQTRS